MKCKNKTEFGINRYDVAEMLYKRNREYILDVVKHDFQRFTKEILMRLSEGIAFKVEIPVCLACTFESKCTAYGKKRMDCFYETFLHITFCDIRMLIERDCPVKCRLQMPLIGVKEAKLYEPKVEETVEMEDFLNSLVGNDEDLFAEVRESITNRGN